MRNFSRAFTLIELIIVILILSILSLISYIAYEWYTVSARDSGRVANLSNAHKWLWTLFAKSWTYPLPESMVSILASGSVIGYQWYIKEQTASLIKMTADGVKDFSDKSLYSTYFVNANKTKIELMCFLEKLPKLALVSSDAYALSSTDYSLRFPFVKWDILGVLIWNGSGGTVLNQPIQETGTWVDVVNTNSGFIAIFDNSSSSTVTGTGNILAQLNPTSTCKRIMDLGNSKGDGYYSINPKWTYFTVYCDMTTDGGGWTRLLDYKPQNTTTWSQFTDGGGGSLSYSAPYMQVASTIGGHWYKFLDSSWSLSIPATKSFLKVTAKPYVYNTWNSYSTVYTNSSMQSYIWPCDNQNTPTNGYGYFYPNAWAEFSPTRFSSWTTVIQSVDLQTSRMSSNTFYLCMQANGWDGANGYTYTPAFSEVEVYFK